VPPGKSLEEAVGDLSRDAGGWSTLILPAFKKYKLEVVLDVLEESESDQGDERASTARVEASGHFEPTDKNIRVVRCIQEDLPLNERPFGVWAEKLGMREEELLSLISRWLEQGVIRRFAAILNHRQVGFSANGMVVWNAPLDQIDAYGAILAAHPEVSHCYYRPGYPEWPFNLYAMVHGRSVEDCRRIADRLGSAIGLSDYRILFSTREYKKIRLKLFWA
jgi:DNA-binding Lrp family transcriptional regulator